MVPVLFNFLFLMYHFLDSNIYLQCSVFPKM